MELYILFSFFWEEELYSNIRHLLWLYLYMELCISLFKENIIYQDSNGEFKLKKINFKFN